LDATDARKSQMKIATGLIITLLLVTLPNAKASFAAESLQKIRVGLPSLALTYMPYYVAQE